MLAELDTHGNLLVHYTRAGDRLLSQTRNTQARYYILDGLGSVRLLTNELGMITDAYDFDAFGNLVFQTGTTENSFLFTGERFDANTGFYHLRARFMDPSVGRFISMDEWAGMLTNPVTMHSYIYANANPVVFVDPTGYFSMLTKAMFTSALISGSIYAIINLVFQGVNIWITGEGQIDRAEVALNFGLGFIGGLAGFSVSYTFTKAKIAAKAENLLFASIGPRLTLGISNSILGGLSYVAPLALWSDDDFDSGTLVITMIVSGATGALAGPSDLTKLRDAITMEAHSFRANTFNKNPDYGLMQWLSVYRSMSHRRFQARSGLSFFGWGLTETVPNSVLDIVFGR